MVLKAKIESDLTTTRSIKYTFTELTNLKGSTP